MAEFYASVRPENLQPDPAQPPTPPVIVRASKRQPQLQADLPGIGTLNNASQRQLLLNEVTAGLQRITPTIGGAGLTVPTAPDFASMLLVAGEAGRRAITTEVLRFHVDVLTSLAAADPRLGKAYGLGRALADLVLRPQHKSQAMFTSDLRSGRVLTLAGDLGVLKSALPAHAAQAVASSMQMWQQWAEKPVWDGAPLNWATQGKQVTAAFKVQGERWRALLVGEKDPLDELTAEDYVDAGGYLLGRMRVLLQQFALQYWPVVLVLLALGVVGLVLALVGPPEIRGASVVVTVLGGLGVTGASVGGALRRVASGAEDYLWEAELDLAVARAIFMLPADADSVVMGEPRAPVPRVTARFAARRARSRVQV